MIDLLDQTSKALFFLADFLREEAERKKRRRNRRTSTGKIHAWWVLTPEQTKVISAFLGLRNRNYDSAEEMAKALSPWADRNSRTSVLKKKLALGWKKIRFVLQNEDLINSLPEIDQTFYLKLFEAWADQEIDAQEIEQELIGFLGKDKKSLSIIS